MCKQHFRPWNRGQRRAWAVWERQNRGTQPAARDELAPPRRVRATY